MQNWYSNFKSADFDWDNFTKTLIPTLGIAASAMMIALYFGWDHQKALQIVQEQPEQAEALLQQIPPEEIQKAQEQSPQIEQPVQNEVPEDFGIISADEVEGFISDNEGFNAKSYQDTPENRSIAFGFNLDRPDARELLENMGYDFEKVYNGSQQISLGDGMELRDYAIEEAIEIANDFSGGLQNHPKNVQIVLTDMAYNLGSPRFNGFVKMKQAIAQKDYQLAAQEMVDSKWYKDVPNRAKKLVELMNN